MAEAAIEGVEANDDLDRERTEAFVVFRLGEEHYALEVARVREVLDVGTLTRVPGGSRSLSGLCNLRGHVVPVWDLRAPFGLAEGGPSERGACVLIVEPEAGRATRVAGLLVDRVADVLDFHPDAVEPPPDLGLGGGSVLVRGLLKHQDRFLLVLDLDRVFTALVDPTASEGAP